MLYSDGSVILWDIRDLNQKEHKTLRVNIEFDYASHVAWSPDSKAFIVHTVRDNHIIVYKIEKKKDGTIGSATPVITFDKVSEFLSTSLSLPEPGLHNIPNHLLMLVRSNFKRF